MNSANHIAIIMDGNGRWANQRRRPRVFGHIKGARVAKKMISECARCGIQSLTLYAFSTENWARPRNEVQFLMRLLHRHIRRERQSLVEQNIKFGCIGEIWRLPRDVRQELEKTIMATSQNTGMNLTFALSYGGRQEIVRAARKIVDAVQCGDLSRENIDIETFSQMLQTRPSEDPDLVIRTSGESRLSNFLLWQCAYSELFFTDKLWPDFTEEDLHSAIASYSARERRFGRILKSTPPPPEPGL